MMIFTNTIPHLRTVSISTEQILIMGNVVQNIEQLNIITIYLKKLSLNSMNLGETTHLIMNTDPTYLLTEPTYHFFHPII